MHVDYGHKTEHVFERYNITDTADIREALIKVASTPAKRLYKIVQPARRTFGAKKLKAV